MSVGWPKDMVEAIDFGRPECVAIRMLSGRNSDMNVQATGNSASDELPLENLGH